MEEGGGALRCNGCWSVCESTQHSVATACQHLYCLSCCQTILESDDPTCPICSQARRRRLSAADSIPALPASLAALFTVSAHAPPLLQLIQKSSVKAVHVLSSAADLRLAVAGQTPKVALEVAHAAIQFCELLLGQAVLAVAGTGAGAQLPLATAAGPGPWMVQHPRLTSP